MKTILTGVKPTGQPHLGNYVGAIKPGLELVRQASVERSLFFIADYHSLTAVHDGERLNQQAYEVAATWLACGLDPSKTLIYRQSDVPETFELAWILSCFTPKGFMNRAHAYKAKVQENEEAGQKDPDAGVNVGLFTYPVLMSADILLFNANMVPVGEDQIQHIEFARDIAARFNNNYGEILTIPEAIVRKDATLPGLDGRKMSKSYDNHIPLFLDSKQLRKRVMKIKTDSQPPEVPKNPDESLVFDIYKFFATPDELADLRAWYEKGIGWGEAKQVLFEKLDSLLSEPRMSYVDWMSRKDDLDKVLKQGCEKARDLCAPLMKELRQAVGVSRNEKGAQNAKS